MEPPVPAETSMKVGASGFGAVKNGTKVPTPNSKSYLKS
jgi:hypothetical protein